MVYLASASASGAVGDVAVWRQITCKPPTFYRGRYAMLLANTCASKLLYKIEDYCKIKHFNNLELSYLHPTSKARHASQIWKPHHVNNTPLRLTSTKSLALSSRNDRRRKNRLKPSRTCIRASISSLDFPANPQSPTTRASPASKCLAATTGEQS